MRGVQGVKVTSEAFGSAIPWFPYVLTVAVILFAFSTMISWSYYGERALTYLTGERKGVLLAYPLAFLSMHGDWRRGGIEKRNWRVRCDVFLRMVVPNLIGLYVLLPVVKRELNIFVESAKGK